jgi:hypothetical protein
MQKLHGCLPSDDPSSDDPSSFRYRFPATSLVYDNAVPFAEGRRIATSITNAKFVVLDSENHVPLLGEPAWSKFMGEIEKFLFDV